MEKEDHTCHVQREKTVFGLLESGLSYVQDASRIHNVESQGAYNAIEKRSIPPTKQRSASHPHLSNLYCCSHPAQFHHILVDISPTSHSLTAMCHSNNILGISTVPTPSCWSRMEVDRCNRPVGYSRFLLAYCRIFDIYLTFIHCVFLYNFLYNILYSW